MLNKTYLLFQKPKSHKLLHVILFIITITSILLSYKIKTYDSLTIIGIYKCEETCYIDTSLSYEYLSKIDNNSIIEYKNKTYIIEDISYNEPYLNNNIAYQDIKITSNLKPQEDIINMKLLYNKQRIITKIKKLIIGED